MRCPAVLLPLICIASLSMQAAEIASPEATAAAAERSFRELMQSPGRMMREGMPDYQSMIKARQLRDLNPRAGAGAPALLSASQEPDELTLNHLGFLRFTSKAVYVNLAQPSRRMRWGIGGQVNTVYNGWTPYHVSDYQGFLGAQIQIGRLKGAAAPAKRWNWPPTATYRVYDVSESKVSAASTEYTIKDVKLP